MGNRMDDPYLIWRPDGGQRHRLLRPTSGQVQICRDSNGNQKTRSRHQSKAWVMYITPVPTKSTLDLYIERNQKWKICGVHMNFMIFENWKDNNVASMQRTSDHTTTAKDKHHMRWFKEIKIRSKPLICRAWRHNSVVLMLAVCSREWGSKV